MGTHMKRRSKRKSRKSRKRRAGAVDRCILKCKADADAVIKQAKKAKKALVTRTGKSLKERMAAYEKAAAGVKRGVGEMSADAIKARKEIDDAKKVKRVNTMELSVASRGWAVANASAAALNAAARAARARNPAERPARLSAAARARSAVLAAAVKFSIYNGKFKS